MIALKAVRQNSEGPEKSGFYADVCNEELWNI